VFTEMRSCSAIWAFVSPSALFGGVLCNRRDDLRWHPLFDGGRDEDQCVDAVEGVGGHGGEEPAVGLTGECDTIESHGLGTRGVAVARTAGPRVVRLLEGAELVRASAKVADDLMVRRLLHRYS